MRGMFNGMQTVFIALNMHNMSHKLFFNCRQEKIVDIYFKSILFLDATCVTTCPEPDWGIVDTNVCCSSCTNSNEFGDVSDNRICKTCDISCLTCSGTATTCTSCTPPLYLTRSFCLCPNSNEYVDTSDNNLCKTCDSSCQTCFGTATTCTSCVSPRYLSTSNCIDACIDPQWGNNSTRTCDNTCTGINEFGDVSDNRICKTCDSNCKTCQTTATTCTSCDVPYYLSLSVCVTACPSPKWGNKNSRTCDNSCTNTNEFGDVTDNRICKICSTVCASCSGSADICTKCPSNQLLYDSRTSGGTNFDKCIDKIYLLNPNPQYGNMGFYQEDSRVDLNTGLAVALLCSSPCRTCIGKNLCMSCSAGLYLYDSSTSITCTKCEQVGFFIKGD
jgi:hypothetical protein